MSKLPIHRAAAPKIKDKITRGLKDLPEVIIIRPWRGYGVGARIRPPGVLRQVLLQQNIAEMLDAKPEKLVKAKAKKVKKEKVESD